METHQQLYLIKMNTDFLGPVVREKKISSQKPRSSCPFRQMNYLELKNPKGQSLELLQFDISILSFHFLTETTITMVWSNPSTQDTEGHLFCPLDPSASVCTIFPLKMQKKYFSRFFGFFCQKNPETFFRILFCQNNPKTISFLIKSNKFSLLFLSKSKNPKIISFLIKIEFRLIIMKFN